MVITLLLKRSVSDLKRTTVQKFINEKNHICLGWPSASRA